jgi:uncharacterized caspase-like protein
MVEEGDMLNMGSVASFGLNRRAMLVGGTLMLGAFATPAMAKKVKTDAAMAHALVISLSYDATAIPLSNTHNDGRLITKQLAKLKFASVDHLQDPDETIFKSRLQAFVDRLKPGELAFVYYAGHGVQIGGVNYLLMADGHTFVSMQSVVATLRDATDTVILLLDACRDDPTKVVNSGDGRTIASRSIKSAEVARITTGSGASQIGYVLKTLQRDSGIARIGSFEIQGTGVRIVFATDPQNTAADATDISDQNGPFALALSARLLERRSLDDVITLATGDVVATTEGYQSPWSQGSIGRPLYLAGPPENKNPAKVPFPVPG